MPVHIAEARKPSAVKIVSAYEVYLSHLLMPNVRIKNMRMGSLAKYIAAVAVKMHAAASCMLACQLEMPAGKGIMKEDQSPGKKLSIRW